MTALGPDDLRAVTPSPTAIRVVIAEDVPLLRQGLARLLGEHGFDVVGQAAGPDDAIRLVREHVPDVAILDIRMPPTQTDEGLQAAAAIRKEFGARVGVLLLSQYVEPGFSVNALADGRGGVGYLLKDRVADAGALAEALRRIAAGENVIDPEVVKQLMHRRRARDPVDELSERERETLALMAEGRSNQAIAERLFVTPKTVEAHIANVFGKLGLLPAADDHRRVLAVIAFLRAEPPPR